MKKILLLTIFLSSYSWSSDYKVCITDHITDLEECVKSYTLVGYIPHGGISVTKFVYKNSERRSYYQAVYKE